MNTPERSDPGSVVVVDMGFPHGEKTFSAREVLLCEDAISTRAPMSGTAPSRLDWGARVRGSPTGPEEHVLVEPFRHVWRGITRRGCLLHRSMVPE